jgi:hypothetical protein
MVETAQKSLREKSEFASGFNADLAVQSVASKYFCLRKSEIMHKLGPIPPRCEGRYASSRTRGGVRWTRAAARRAARLADDEIVWFWRPWAGAKFAGDDPANDGDYKVTDTGKSAKISR